MHYHHCWLVQTLTSKWQRMQSHESLLRPINVLKWQFNEKHSACSSRHSCSALLFTQHPRKTLFTTEYVYYIGVLPWMTPLQICIMFLNSGHTHTPHLPAVIRPAFCELRREASFWGSNFWARDLNASIPDTSFTTISLTGTCV